MSTPTQTHLHPLLRTFPGAVLEVALDGTVMFSNGVLESVASATVGRPLFVVLDAVSRDKLVRLLATPADALPARCELTVEGRSQVETRGFWPSWWDADGERRLVLVELPRDPRADRLHDELQMVNAQMANTQRELAKKSGRLTRALEEYERKLAENERLSQILQYQNEQMEAQNEELLAMTEELHAGQDELLQLNHQLERKTRELQIALSARNRFYAAMSHELRTPINAVMGYNDLLLAGVYGPLMEQQELAVERAQTAVRHLRELVDDVLDLSKAEAGKMEVEVRTFSLRGLLEELLATMEPVAAAHGSLMSLSMGDAPEEVTSDPRRVRQIVLNLVSNALKYGGEGPVWVQCSRDGGGGVAVEVTDSGAGIAAEEMSGIFDEFVQVGTVEAQGTGLGLSIAKRLATVLGGTLQASSTVGVGSVFRLTLPPTPPAQ